MKDFLFNARTVGSGELLIKYNKTGFPKEEISYLENLFCSINNTMKNNLEEGKIARVYWDESKIYEDKGVCTFPVFIDFALESGHVINVLDSFIKNYVEKDKYIKEFLDKNLIEFTINYEEFNLKDNFKNECEFVFTVINGVPKEINYSEINKGPAVYKMEDFKFINLYFLTTDFKEGFSYIPIDQNY